MRKLIWCPFCFFCFSLHIKIIYKVGAIGDQNGQFGLDKGWSEQQEGMKTLWKKIIGCQTGFALILMQKIVWSPIWVFFTCAHMKVRKQISPNEAWAFFKCLQVFQHLFSQMQCKLTQSHCERPSWVWMKLQWIVQAFFELSINKLSSKNI